MSRTTCLLALLFYVARLKTVVSRHSIVKINCIFRKTCLISLNIERKYNIQIHLSYLHAVLARYYCLSNGIR